jgi:hypothetical protein
MRSRLLLIALGTFFPVSAYADTCIMKQHVVAQSSDGRYIVRLDLADVWKGHIEDSVPVNHGTPRPGAVDAKGLGGEYWIETLQRRKPRK